MSVQEYMIKFCNNVKSKRKKQGMTLAELAERSGLPMNMLEALDRNEIPEEMMVNDAFNLAKVFGCKVYELFQ